MCSHIKILFFLLLLSASLHAQEIELKHLKKYTQTEGLSSYNVRKVIEDNNGFIWVATQEGIDRFDGVNFVNYKKNNVVKRRICGIDIREIVRDTNRNCLWVLPGEFGLNAIDLQSGDVTETISIPYANSNTWNLTMILVNDRLWIGTSTGLSIYNIEKRKFENDIPVPPAMFNRSSDYEVKNISKDFLGNIWVCYRGVGITVYSPSLKIINSIPLSQFNVGQLNTEIIFNSSVFINPKQILLATDHGLRKIGFDKFYHFFVNNNPCKSLRLLNIQGVNCVFKTSENELLIAATEGLFKFDTSLVKYSVFNEDMPNINENWLEAVQSLCLDSENNIWIGCQKGLGFISHKALPFKTYYLSNTMDQRLEHVRSLCKLNNGNFLVGLRNGIVYIDQKKNKFAINNKEHLFHHIYQDKHNLIHVSRYDGMFIYANNDMKPIEQVYTEFKNFSKYPINSHLFIGDSLIVLGTETDKGILIWDYVNHHVTQINEKSKPLSLKSNIVNNIYSDNKDNLWVLSDNIISVISKTKKTIKTLNLVDNITKQSLGLYFDMIEANGSYWIVSYGSGIIQLDSTFTIKKVYSTMNGLSNDGVYQIFNYKNSLLVTSNYGLSVLDLNTMAVKKYFESDGLHSNGFEEVAGMMKDGIIYAGGVKGFTEIHPDFLYGNALPPKFYINRILLENSREEIDSSNLFFKSFNIPSNTLQANIYFSALNFSNPTRTTYAYRIIEQSKDWVNLNSQNFVTLIGLSPGTYHLQVKAANEDGVWSESKELILIFEPKWYQTWWFKLLIFLTTAGIIYAFYRYRITQIKKQHEIRKNIATDLHDDLGSTLNSVKVFTNLAISGVKQEESLQQVKDNLTEATMSLRDMIWVLDDSLDTVDELITRLKQFAIPVAAASNIEAIIKADSEVNSRQLTKEEKRNLFLICKEAINNSIKYSEATQINVTITASGKKIQIVVADNGKGFNVDEVKKGYGLKNMQYRAGQIKYKVALVSSPGKGTQVEIKPT